jgi:signal transduction histidine kinase
MHIHDLNSLPQDLLGTHFENLRFDTTLEYESTLHTHGGYELPVQVDVRQVHQENALRLQWIFRDLTERKKLDALRNDLTSMIYHDLRSPLANVVSSLDILKTMLVSKEEQEFKPLLDIALRSTSRIQRLTDSLLDMSQLEAGIVVVNSQPVKVDQLVHEAVDIVTPMTQTKGHLINQDLAAELPFAQADPDMTRRVLINLLENALKYTSQGSLITVGTCREGEMVQVWVKDNGPGIPTSEHERIFDKFSRLKLDAAPKGFGLGLAYCRLAVEAQGGKIWVESEVGSGSRFIFTLPIVGRLNESQVLN